VGQTPLFESRAPADKIHEHRIETGMIAAEPIAPTALAPGLDPAAASIEVLIAEDNPIFQTLLRGLLGKWGYRTVLARDGEEAWRLLDSVHPPRMAILDWMMPGMDGVELCRRARAVARERYVYIVLLTARADSGDLVEGMEAGADDYLTKPFHPHELRVRLRAGRRILELQEELLVAREALREQATHDALTGLLNRGAVLDALRHQIERAVREARPVAVLLADLDRFKLINDTCGHLAGDAALRATAARMKSAVRGYDVIGRYGGEEFLVVLPGCDLAAAVARAESIRQAVAAVPLACRNGQLPMTCSIGLACHAGPAPADSDVLIQEADRALYAAKNRGRNRVETAPAGLFPGQSGE
jgi:two-component system cell cycle response regulator